MNAPQITLTLTNGKTIDLTVSATTILAKRNYFRLGQHLTAIGAKSATIVGQINQTLNEIQELVKSKASQEEVDTAQKKFETLTEKRVAINDEAFVVSAQRALAVLVPVDPEASKPKYDDVVWDDVDDSKLEECTTFFTEMCSSKMKSTSEEEPSLTS